MILVWVYILFEVEVHEIHLQDQVQISQVVEKIVITNEAIDTIPNKRQALPRKTSENKEPTNSVSSKLLFLLVTFVP